MEQAINRYSQFKVKTLLESVQKAGKQFSDPKFRKEMSYTKRSQFVEHVSELQRALIPKLEKMDRMSVEFFPPAALIEYHPVENPDDLFDFNKQREPSRFGHVVGHEGRKVLVQLEGLACFFRADPQNLRLRFIRTIM